MEKQQIDYSLIELVIAQDRKAQFQLFEMTKRMVYSLAFRILNDEDTAHDVLQDTYVKVFQEIRNLKHPEALISWMKTIAARKAVERAKRQFEFEELSAVDERVEDHFEAWFDAELLDQAIRSLPPSSRTVFMLVAVEGYPHQEAARMLGISENTSKSQLNYARKLLKTRIKTLLQA
ncbi:sigma-70 family RNA polymerase sigma factor [Algoriphagus sp. H41]|uniref:Sigma-70 family RNA polymerase sigma factor n=1 Tax=Algoriphagus oliviformis TaxID=2811231 RepID=A0ABS3C5D2_9BACT|nr:sigma-70 family RNA polymerase sigma factor [Algoriphagus oliviformis]MBN7811375.1 sigma-70 family RNA polymerase sigma factor [Algoriphagus oliviformis]